MGRKTNSIIKFDLHIHSIASKYKEAEGIVDNSTIENLDVLLSKLNENNVALFSITDHNRFDSNLYEKIQESVCNPDCKYTNVKNILAGVEFDVIMDAKKEKCHIIAIFDTNNEKIKYKKIEEVLSENPILKDEAYSKDDFERILKKIGLNTILIASQHKDIHSSGGKHRSLSDSVDVEEVIKVGYIEALEFQKPKVEGILINNLKDLPSSISLLSGSDCHDWNHYPYHDSKNQNKEFYHSKAKMLPTFKGLSMAVSSPETRFNCSENSNLTYISKIKVNGDEIEVVNGINAIIGENGSGKTTLLKLINNDAGESHVKKLIKENDMIFDENVDQTRVKYVKQGEIIRRFNENTLFETNGKNNFKEIDNGLFQEIYTKYTNDIRMYIEHNIELEKNRIDLNRRKISYDETLNSGSYYVQVVLDVWDIGENIHEIPLNEIKEVNKKLKQIFEKSYFIPYLEKITLASAYLSEVEKDVNEAWRQVDYESKVKNIVFDCTNNYNIEKGTKATEQERDITNYNKRKQDVINSVVKAISDKIKILHWPEQPEIVEGRSTVKKRGFHFNREAAYNDISMVDQFYQKMFTSKFREKEQLLPIKDRSELSKAIMGCTASSNIDQKWTENLDKFLKESVRYSDYITDGSNQEIGSTLGELALSYYKYFTQDVDSWDVLIIDQPEDNISNSNISNNLIKYFNSIRDEKQIIFVTHNPLLVVNIDVDNVILLKKEATIQSKNGCLEYEDDDIDILEIIANNMDGGKDAIEKRLKIYGKKYKHCVEK